MDAWSLAFSPDSQYVATGSHIGKVNIFGVETGKKEYSLDTRGKFILSIAYVRNLDFCEELGLINLPLTHAASIFVVVVVVCIFPFLMGHSSIRTVMCGSLETGRPRVQIPIPP